ncbi:MAG: hypothetical protein KBD60_06305 [Sterolibacterium sp.]|nr:hypothetical protein [Sterolibacterium sp.]
MEKPIDFTPSNDHRPLTWTWLALVALTLLSLELGRWMHGAALLQVVVAAIIWFKGRLVARHFIEAHIAYPYIRNLLNVFIAFAPLALLMIVFFGREFARWATL